MKLFGRKGSRRSEEAIWLDKVELLWERHKLFTYMILYLFWPAILVFLFECMNNRSLFGALFFVTHYTWAYLCNILIVSTSFSFAMLIRKRIVFILAMSFFWTFCAFTNFVLLLNRVTPLTANDFVLITDLFGVVFKYLNLFQACLLFAVIGIVVLGIIALFIKAPALKKRVNYVFSVTAIVFMFMLTSGAITLGHTMGTVESQFHELSQSYKKNGFLYCFMNSLTDIGIKKPSDYSEDRVETMVEEEKVHQNDSENKIKEANVIIVQLESFFDPNRIAGVTYSENPIPNFTRLMESKKTGSGYFGVPVIGAGTVNSEFEVLTGMNIDDFGAGEYPYKTILKKKTCESIAYNMKENGYGTHAIHNHVGSFYGRNSIYEHLGFDSFTSLEYMWPKDYTGMNWAKDTVLTGEIKRAIDSTEGLDFVYTVSVQGHGKYPGDNSVPYRRHIEVSSDTMEESYLNQVSYYVNQLYEMDQFVGELLDYCKNQKENTILVLYGDHLPSLNLNDEDLTAGNIYQTEYVIWNNLGLSFKKEDIEAYQLGSKILNQMHIGSGVINSYHQKYFKKKKSESMTEEDYLEGLKTLEYDILYGDQVCYNGVNPYAPTIMQMGINPIQIESIEKVNDMYVVRGSNFTRYSMVYVNEESQNTYYYSSEKLYLKTEETNLESGDMVEVRQRNLSSTDPYYYEALEEESSEAVVTDPDAIQKLQEKDAADKKSKREKNKDTKSKKAKSKSSKKKNTKSKTASGSKS